MGHPSKEIATGVNSLTRTRCELDAQKNKGDERRKKRAALIVHNSYLMTNDCIMIASDDI